MTSKIRKSDVVLVLSGKDKGKTGTVLRMIKSNDRVLVSGINMIKRHVKPNPSKNQPGGIVSKEASIHVSNVSLIDPSTNKPSRVGIKQVECGNNIRIYKSSGKEVATK